MPKLKILTLILQELYIENLLLYTKRHDTQTLDNSHSDGIDCECMQKPIKVCNPSKKHDENKIALSWDNTKYAARSYIFVLLSIVTLLMYSQP